MVYCSLSRSLNFQKMLVLIFRVAFNSRVPRWTKMKLKWPHWSDLIHLTSFDIIFRQKTVWYFNEYRYLVSGFAIDIITVDKIQLIQGLFKWKWPWQFRVAFDGGLIWERANHTPGFVKDSQIKTEIINHFLNKRSIFTSIRFPTCISFTHPWIPVITLYDIISLIYTDGIR